MPPVGFEPMISAGERSQTYALDRVATGTGGTIIFYYNIIILNVTGFSGLSPDMYGDSVSNP